MWTMRSGCPCASRIGLTAANASASPPTMIDSVALMAPISPPLTGASSIVRAARRPRAAEPARDRRRDAAHVDHDGVALDRAEDAVRASSTSSTSGESGSIVMMRVACRATSAGDAARVAPRPQPVRRPVPGCGCGRRG